MATYALLLRINSFSLAYILQIIKCLQNNLYGPESSVATVFNLSTHVSDSFQQLYLFPR